MHPILWPKLLGRNCPNKAVLPFTDSDCRTCDKTGNSWRMNMYPGRLKAPSWFER